MSPQELVDNVVEALRDVDYRAAALSSWLVEIERIHEKYGAPTAQDWIGKPEIVFYPAKKRERGKPVPPPPPRISEWAQTIISARDAFEDFHTSIQLTRKAVDDAYAVIDPPNTPPAIRLHGTIRAGLITLGGFFAKVVYGQDGRGIFLRGMYKNCGPAFADTCIRLQEARVKLEAAGPAKQLLKFDGWTVDDLCRQGRISQSVLGRMCAKAGFGPQRGEHSYRFTMAELQELIVVARGWNGPSRRAATNWETYLNGLS